MALRDAVLREAEGAFLFDPSCTKVSNEQANMLIHTYIKFRLNSKVYTICIIKHHFVKLTM